MSLARRLARLGALAALAALLPACDGASSGCANDLPAACPAPVPSFTTQVQPLLQARCGGCHVEGGVAPDRRFDSWDLVHQQRTSILSQVYACWMPPLPGAEPRSPAERALLLGWLVCGAPDS